ncbi:MAG: VWA domain-containing protein, partial [Gammaproteobacteria bacterium]|nr:VWA domain-containing protein [Gammaproteobacteria bacterium]
MLHNKHTLLSLIPRSNSRSTTQKKVKFPNPQSMVFIYSIPICFILASGVSAKEVITNPIPDIRVLVDISGSMKKTDPKNLRQPAIRLLAGLIPAGSRSGIWNFGKQVNMSVKVGSVNKAWRSLAREQSKKINSVGLYTNIESAMRKASFDWKNPDPRYKRNLILLTDGHVDVSFDDKKDKASKKRILKEI